MASSTAGKKTEPKPAQGWLAKARETWARLRGHEDFRLIAIFFAVFCAAMILGVVLSAAISFFSTVEMTPAPPDELALGTVIAGLCLLFFVCVGILRDRLWAWWVAIFALGLNGVARAWEVVVDPNPSKYAQWVHYFYVIAALYLPLLAYSDLKKMRRRKQAEREASGVNRSQ